MFDLTNKNPKKAMKPLETDYHLITPLRQYQATKKILPSFYRPFAKMAYLEAKDKFQDKNGKLFFVPDDESIPVATMAMIDRLESGIPLPQGGCTYAAFAYIISERKFDYAKSGDRHEACSLTLEIEGRRIDAVKWPNRKGELPHPFNDTLVGAVGVVIFHKQQEKPLQILNFVVISPPEPTKKEESK
jgi:hypothetical protein